MWLGIAVLMSALLSVPYFFFFMPSYGFILVNGRIAVIEPIVVFCIATTGFLYFSLYLSTAFFIIFETQLEKISSQLRNLLPWKEYIDIKKSMQINLTKKDKKLARQNIDEKDISLFFKHFITRRKLSNIDWFFLTVAILAFVIDFVFYRSYIFTPYHLIRAMIKIICGIWFIFFLTKKRLVNHYKFVKFLDTLVETNET